MGIGRVGRIGRVSRVGAGGLGPDAAHTILTIADNGTGDLLVTTAGPHGLIGSEQVVFSGTSVPGYNEQTPATATPEGDPNKFVAIGIPYTADATGGTWALA